MKKTRRLIPLLLIVFMLSTLFAGCSSDELTLLNALMNSSKITSMESTTSLAMNISAEGLPKEDQQSFDQIAAMLSNSKLVIKQKMTSNEAQTVSKSQTDVNVNFGGMAFDASVWADVDMTGATPKIKEIIKLPPIATMSFPPAYQNKTYMVIDAGKMMNMAPEAGIDFSKLAELGKGFSAKTADFIKEYAAQFNPGFAVVTRQGDKTVGGQTLAMYNLKLDDAAFKKLLDYTVKNFSQNEKAMGFIKDFMYSVIDSVEVSEAEKAQAKKEIEESFGELKAGIPEFLAEWDKVMSVLKDVKILGDKGINIDFGVDGNGYVVSESGTVDLVLDLGAISDASEKFMLLEDSSYKASASDESGIIKITITFDSLSSNINKNVVVTIPEVNSQNSFDYIDYMNSQNPVVPPAKEDTKPVTPPVKKDVTAPKAPVVNKVLRTSTKVTGKAEAGSTITVKKGNSVLGKAVTNSKGAFSVTIKPVKAKCTLTVTATDKAGNVSKAAKVTVS